MVAVRFLYLALHLESSSFPQPLPARREIEAFERLAAGDQTAKELLIRHNLRLVAHVAKKYYSAPADQEDLISIGTIGLIKAVNSFDYKKGARFATYAARCIENAILTQTPVPAGCAGFTPDTGRWCSVRALRWPCRIGWRSADIR